MEEYPSRHPGHNPLLPPPIPRLTWNAEQRRAVMGARNPQHQTGKGTKRRQRREVETKQRLAWLADVLRGADTYRGADDALHSLRDLIHRAPPKARTQLRPHQARARALLSLVVQHGPASGWAVAQGTPSGDGAHFSPWIVPKASEKCWRWWRAMVAALRALALYLAACWGEPVPAHSTGRDCASNQEAQARPSGGEEAEQRTVCRDRWALDEATRATWRQQAWAM